MLVKLDEQFVNRPHIFESSTSLTSSIISDGRVITMTIEMTNTTVASSVHIKIKRVSEK